MLYQIRIPFTSEKNLRYGWASASLLHGLLMERVSSETAELLHTGEARVFSQSAVYSNQEQAWIVSTLTQEAYTKIITPMLAMQSAEIIHRNDVLHFGDPQIRRTSYDDLFKKHYIQGQPSRLVQIEFLTPTAFKSGGEYINIPTPRLILMGLARRYDAMCSVHETLYDSLAEEIGSQVSIASYRLRSTAFPLENVRIPAFLGSVTLRINSNETFRRYINLLCDFAGYSGIGIKTALGMGHMTYQPFRE